MEKDIIDVSDHLEEECLCASLLKGFSKESEL
jgi:hypothetical protein